MAAVVAEEGRVRSGRVLAAVRGVHKGFAGMPALTGVTMEIRAGEVHCLIGENGAGKSTLVKLISGVHVPDAGAVEIKGRPRAGSPKAALELGVRTIYQELTLVPGMTVAENIALGREPSRCRGLLRDRRALVRDASDALEGLGIEDISPQALAGELGVAQQQLVEIVKAISSGDEQILILDEPTASLGPDEADRLFEIVRRLTAGGMGALYITHRLEELPRIGMQVTVLRDGQVVTSGPVGSFARSELIELMVGRALDTLYPERACAPGPVVAEITEVAPQYREGPTALDAGAPDSSAGLTIRAGEVAAVFGLVGAGRTELVRSLVGADRGGGTHLLCVDGKPVRASSPRAALRSGVAMIAEDRKAHGLIPHMSVAANIALSSLHTAARAGLTSRARIERAAAGWAERLRVQTGSLRQDIVTLSGGNQQKCLLARALATAPRLIILDEPTRGVDVGARAEVYALINEVCASGAAVLMITSELPEALGMSDRIHVMRSGRFVGSVAARGATEHHVLRMAIESDDRTGPAAAPESGPPPARLPIGKDA
jgi:ABC-type sugar transport system ATPase subunit